MPLYALGDLHLSLSGDKPQDKFRGWENYVERIKNNWTRLVGPDDTVVICGDVSWAMKLEETVEDFAFIDALPGQKLILKGNHDFWWTTKKKMDTFIAEHGFTSLRILFNNSYVYQSETGPVAICGTRGWSYDCIEEEDIKVLNRECGRLRMSIDSAPSDCAERLVFLHYPPVYSGYRCGEIMDVLHEYGIRRCFYAHLHSYSQLRAVTGLCEDIEMRLIAADYVDFTPVLCCK